MELLQPVELVEAKVEMVVFLVVEAVDHGIPDMV